MRANLIYSYLFYIRINFCFRYLQLELINSRICICFLTLNHANREPSTFMYIYIKSLFSDLVEILLINMKREKVKKSKSILNNKLAKFLSFSLLVVVYYKLYLLDCDKVFILRTIQYSRFQ
jgi:hypothetical protein